MGCGYCAGSSLAFERSPSTQTADFLQFLEVLQEVRNFLDTHITGNLKLIMYK